MGVFSKHKKKKKGRTTSQESLDNAAKTGEAMDGAPLVASPPLGVEAPTPPIATAADAEVSKEVSQTSNVATTETSKVDERTNLVEDDETKNDSPPEQDGDTAIVSENAETPVEHPTAVEPAAVAVPSPAMEVGDGSPEKAETPLKQEEEAAEATDAPVNENDTAAVDGTSEEVSRSPQQGLPDQEEAGQKTQEPGADGSPVEAPATAEEAHTTTVTAEAAVAAAASQNEETRKAEDVDAPAVPAAAEAEVEANEVAVTAAEVSEVAQNDEQKADQGEVAVAPATQIVRPDLNDSELPPDEEGTPPMLPSKAGTALPETQDAFAAAAAQNNVGASDALAVAEVESPTSSARMQALKEFTSTVDLPKLTSQKDSVWVWRIQQMKAVDWPKELYGSFHSGDSYLVLHTRQPKRDITLYFWLGEESSTDEQACAAFFAVQLDQYLHGIPVQRREVQGRESADFLSLWRRHGTLQAGLHYLPGGVASALASAAEAKSSELMRETRLLRVKGRRFVRVWECPEPSTRQLNAGDVYVFCTPTRIWLWQGSASNPYEKLKAAEVAHHLKASRSDTEVTVLSAETDSSSADYADFLSALGGSEADIQTCASVGGGDSDIDFEVAGLEAALLVEVAGDLTFRQLATGAPFDASALEAESAYLVYSGSSYPGLFAWVGSHAAPSLKDKLLHACDVFITQNKLPPHTAVSLVKQGSEPAAFLSYFNTATKTPSSQKGASPAARKKLLGGAGQEQAATTANTLYVFSDSSSSGGQLVPRSVPQFHQGDLRDQPVALLDTGKQMFVWVGPAHKKDVPLRSKAKSQAKEVIKQGNRQLNTVMIVDVFAGAEPIAFKDAFDSWDPDMLMSTQEQLQSRLQQLTASPATVSNATPPSAAPVAPTSSDDAVGQELPTPEPKKAPGTVNREAAAVASPADQTTSNPATPPKPASTAPENTETQVAQSPERRDLASTPTRARGEDVNVVSVAKMFEPGAVRQSPPYTTPTPGSALGMDGVKTNWKHRVSDMSYLSMRAPAASAQMPLRNTSGGVMGAAVINPLLSSSVDTEKYADPATTKFPLLELKVAASELPATVDPKHREWYLSDEDFLALFGMDRQKYDSLASWRRINLKKKTGLF